MSIEDFWIDHVDTAGPALGDFCFEHSTSFVEGAPAPDATAGEAQNRRFLFQLNAIGLAVSTAFAAGTAYQQARGLLIAAADDGSDSQRTSARTATGACGQELFGAAEIFRHDPIVMGLCQALKGVERVHYELAHMHSDALRLALLARISILRRKTENDSARSGDQTLVNRPVLPPWRLKRVTHYVEKRLAETIALPDLAAAAGLSRMHFAALFQNTTGVRPHEYVMRRRVERAKALLTQTRASHVSVAFDVGFRSQAHFITVFRRFTGTTPGRWRSQYSH